MEDAALTLVTLRAEALKAASQPTPSHSGGRAGWMDVVRGMAIIAVIVTHASGLVGIGPLRTLSDALHPFRQPLLMLLSGMLLERSLAKPQGAYYIGKLRHIVWPFLIWHAVNITVKFGYHGLMVPANWGPTGHMWYLLFIGIYYFVAPAVLRLPAWLVVPALFVASATLTPPGDWGGLIYFSVFFFAGVLVSRHWGIVRPAFLTQPALVTASVAAAVWLATAAAQHPGQVHSNPLLAPIVVLSFFAFAKLADVVVGTRPGRALAWVGRESLVFYILHLYLQWMIAAIVPSRASEWFRFAVLLLGAFGGSALVAWARPRSRLVAALFEFPRLARRHRGAGRERQVSASRAVLPGSWRRVRPASRAASGS